MNVSKGKEKIGGGKRTEREFMWEHKGRLIHLYGSEIYYLHSQQRKVYIHTKNHTYEIGGKLDDVEEILQDLPIVRTHYSYLVHIRHFGEIKGNVMTMKNGDEIPISARYRKQVYDTVRSCFKKDAVFV